jgi:hypothetical protein
MLGRMVELVAVHVKLILDSVVITNLLTGSHWEVKDLMVQNENSVVSRVFEKTKEFSSK